MANKRTLTDGEDAPAVKRGRGRPPKDPNASPKPAPDPNAPTRGRGRPPKDPNAPPRPVKDSDAPSRGRGRPPKDANSSPKPAKDADVPTPRRGPPPKDSNAAPVTSTTTGKGRGRPRKDTSATPVKVAGKGRGRPKKVEANDATSPSTTEGKPKASGGKGRGRPRKADANGATTPPLVTESAESSTQGPLNLLDILGVYNVTCAAVEENWPDAAKDMSIGVTTIPKNKSALRARFSIGKIQGTMLLAATRDGLDYLCSKIEEVYHDDEVHDIPGLDDYPNLEQPIVYFAWRGCDDDEVYPGTGRSQYGVLTFTDNTCSAFKGISSFPALGEECEFMGTKVADEFRYAVDQWNNFNEEAREANKVAREEAREEANQRREFWK